MEAAISLHQHDLIIITPLLRILLGLVPDKRLQTGNVEMPDLVFKVFRHPIEFSCIEFFYGFNLIHFA
jgi:hypothetical protein